MAKKAKKAARGPAPKDSPGRPSPRRPPVSGKVALRLSRQLLEALDAEVERVRGLRPELRPTRASVVRDCLRKTVLEPSEARWSHPEVWEALRQEADLLEAEADLLRSSSEEAAARSLYLQASAKELEALAILETPGEETILGSLLKAVLLIQKGTGYRRLPTIPGLRPVGSPDDGRPGKGEG
jgi:hypothetical protein